MAYKFQIGSAILSGTMKVEETLNAASGFELAGAAVTATAAELNLLDDITRGSILVGGAAGSAELDAKTTGQILVGDGTDVVSVAVSGDATLDGTGALTIANLAVETAMIADDAVTPAKMSLFDDSLAATNTHILIADGSDYSSFALSGDVTMTNAGVVSIGATKVTDAMLNDDVATGLAGAGLGASSGVLAVQVSGAIVLDNDKVGLSGSIASDGLKFLGGVDSISSLEIDLNNLTAGTVNVANDSIAIVDADDNLTKKESIADLVSAMAGSGLSGVGGVLSVQGDAVHLLSDQNMNLSGGINVYSGAPPVASRAYSLPTGSSLTGGDIIRVKAGDLATNSVSASIQCQGSDNIEGTLTQIDLESPGAAVTIIYTGTGKFAVF